LPGAGHALFLFAHERMVEVLLAERAFAAHRLEARRDDELRRRRVAADVPFPCGHELIRRHLAEDVAQIEVGVGHFLDLLAANVAEIALLAFRHDTSEVCQLSRNRQRCEAANR
jgi:hypothetical protein